MFSYYLKVIEALRPKYFVMENVAGILTKDNGKIKNRILREIKNIVDYKALASFVDTIENAQISDHITNHEKEQEFDLSLKVLKVWIEQDSLLKERRADYLKVLSLFNTPNTPNINRRQKQLALDSLVAYKMRFIIIRWSNFALNCLVLWLMYIGTTKKHQKTTEMLFGRFSR